MPKSAARPARRLPAEAPPDAAFTITATQPSRPPRTLKYGDTFVVLDSRGDIGSAVRQFRRTFHQDTRHLSRLELRVNDGPPLLLGSNLRDDNSAFFVDLTNPDLMDGQRIVMEKDRVHILRTIFLWRDTAYQRLAYAITAVRRSTFACRCCLTTILPICSRCAACTANGAAPRRREFHGDDRVLLVYNGLDGKVRRTALTSIRRRTI